MAEEERASCGGDVGSGVDDTKILMASYEDNTSQGKGWIFDLSSMVHVFS